MDDTAHVGRLGFQVPDVDAAADRFIAIGASATTVVEEGGVRWRVMADPEGNEFCLLPLPAE